MLELAIIWFGVALVVAITFGKTVHTMGKDNADN